MTETQAAREKLVEDFLTVIADSEDLLQSLASAGTEKALRADLEAKLRDARQRLDHLQKDAVATSRAMARDADKYVRDNPWQSVAVAAGAGVLAGLVLGILLSRD